MPGHICVTCGTQFPPAAHPPGNCPICEDQRQYVGWSGQEWTTLEELRRTHKNRIRREELCLWGIRTEPSFAIGQRALIVRTPGRNVLWDCISLIDNDTVEAIGKLGGIWAIAISHPHFYSSMIEWSEAFGNVPIYLHVDDRDWVQRPGPSVVFWDGETRPLADGLTLIRTGGHFQGSQALHWSTAPDGCGVLLTGDLPHVCPDRRWVSFMYSYPNYIPLPAVAVDRLLAALAPYDFDRLYGAWVGRVVSAEAKAVVERSAQRYLQAIEPV